MISLQNYIGDKFINESIAINGDFYEMELFHSSDTLKFDAIFNSNGAEFGSGGGSMLGTGLYANLNEKQVMKHNYGAYSFKFKLRIPIEKCIIANRQIYNRIYKTHFKSTSEVIREQYKKYGIRYSGENDRMDFKSYMSKGFLMMVYYGTYDDESIVLWKHKHRDVDIICTQWRYFEQDWVDASISMDDFENKFDIISTLVKSDTVKERSYKGNRPILVYDKVKADKFLKTLNEKERALFDKYDELFEGELCIIPNSEKIFASHIAFELNPNEHYIIFGDNHSNWKRRNLSPRLTGTCKSLSIVGRSDISGDIHIENLVLSSTNKNGFDAYIYSNYQTFLKNTDNILIDNRNSIFNTGRINNVITGLCKMPGTYDNVQNIIFLNNPKRKKENMNVYVQRTLVDKNTNAEYQISGAKTNEKSIKEILNSKFPNASVKYKSILHSILPAFLKKWLNTAEEIEL